MSDSDPVFNVLFLCTGNSARSILAECILQRLGGGRFKSYSAGSFPKGEVHPAALDVLRTNNYPVDRLRSKSWDVFAAADAPKLDFIFTVCDNAAGEVCPIWPGQPVTAHWGIPDPAAVENSAAVQTEAFAKAYRQMSQRIESFLNIPLAVLDNPTVVDRLNEIGREADATV